LNWGFQRRHHRNVAVAIPDNPMSNTELGSGTALTSPGDVP
jgi:hypothetical protein